MHFLAYYHHYYSSTGFPWARLPRILAALAFLLGILVLGAVSLGRRWRRPRRRSRRR